MVLAYGSEYRFAASRQLDPVAGDQSLFGFRQILEFDGSFLKESLPKRIATPPTPWLASRCLSSWIPATLPGSEICLVIRSCNIPLDGH